MIGKSFLKSLPTALLPLGLSFSALADCGSTVQDTINWPRQSDSRNSNYVGFTMAASKETKFVSYTEGRFDRIEGNQMATSQAATSVFSDRKFARSCVPGEFCLPNQGLDVTKADRVDLKLGTNGNLNVVLRTWGNAPFNVPIYGFLNESNGRSMLVLSLKKDRQQIPW